MVTRFPLEHPEGYAAGLIYNSLVSPSETLGLVRQADLFRNQAWSPASA